MTARPEDGDRILKDVVRGRGAFSVPYTSLRAKREDVLRRYRETEADLAFVDLQHSPATDHEVVDFCAWSAAQGVPVQVRIRHPREAYLIGRYCDFGALSIIVPLVEAPEVVAEAVASFYYPPLCRRSWGPGHAFGAADQKGLAYGEWWNRRGILGVQFESVQAIARCRELIAPGVDLVTFGGMDLGLDLSMHPEAPWADVDACIAHVARELAGSGVRVGLLHAPCGRFEEAADGD